MIKSFACDVTPSSMHTLSLLIKNLLLAARRHVCMHVFLMYEKVK